MLTVITKTFKQLTTDELYAILQLRSEVFVVEQDCVYQDLDYKDQKALHVLGLKNKNLVAYTRIFKPNDYFENASIGRVIVKENERKYSYGYEIMDASIKAIKDYYNETKIKISAQVYLNKFYTNLGFNVVGETYLEDGIPHVGMLKD